MYSYWFESIFIASNEHFTYTGYDIETTSEYKKIRGKEAYVIYGNTTGGKRYMVGIVYVRSYRVTASENFIVEYIKTVLKLN